GRRVHLQRHDRVCDLGRWHAQRLIDQSSGTMQTPTCSKSGGAVPSLKNATQLVPGPQAPTSSSQNAAQQAEPAQSGSTSAVTHKLSGAQSLMNPQGSPVAMFEAC